MADETWEDLRAVKHCPSKCDGLVVVPCLHPSQVISRDTTELNVQSELLRWLELIEGFRTPEKGKSYSTSFCCRKLPI